MTIPTQITLWLRKHRSTKPGIARNVTGIHLAANTESLPNQSTQEYKCADQARYEEMPRIDASEIGGSAA
jgi:hypothetical protein